MKTIINLKESKIVNFYANKNIFITGASGFIGKVLIEKLLRTCPDINKIYILLRGKKGQTPQQRLDSEFANYKLFEKLDKNLIESKLQALEGDLKLRCLGLKEDDINELSSNVNIVFHVAASLRFNDPLKESLRYNVIGTKYVIDLCNSIKNLDSFVHVSTAYAYCQLECSEEKIYPLKASASQIIEVSKWTDDSTLEQLSESLMEGRPNTYTFTKAVAENYINENCANLPVAIARPSIVTATASEPFAGWIDSVNGPSGASMLGALGILRTMKIKLNYKVDLIPVDIVTNSLIVIAWKTSVDFEKKQKKSNNNMISSTGRSESFDKSISKTIPVYNLTSGDVNPIIWRQYFQNMRDACLEMPSIKMIRIPFEISKEEDQVNSYAYFATKFFSETLFAYLVDMILLLTGHKAIMSRVVSKLHYALSLLENFMMNQWSFPCDNLLSLYDSLNETDQKLFNFDLRKLDWNTYMFNFYVGIRRHLMKENDNNVPKALRRMRRLKIGYKIGNSVMIALIFIFCAFLLWLFSAQQIILPSSYQSNQLSISEL